MSPLVPNEEFPNRCKQEDQEVEEVWEGQGPTERRCDLARGTIGGKNSKHGLAWHLIMVTHHDLSFQVTTKLLLRGLKVLNALDYIMLTEHHCKQHLELSQDI